MLCVARFAKVRPRLPGQWTGWGAVLLLMLWHGGVHGLSAQAPPPARPSSLEVRLATLGDAPWEEAELRLAAELRWEGFRVSRRPPVDTLEAGGALCGASSRCLYVVLSRRQPGRVVAVVSRAGALRPRRLSLPLEDESREAIEDVMARAVGFARAELVALAELHQETEEVLASPAPTRLEGDEDRPRLRPRMFLVAGLELARDELEPLLAARVSLRSGSVWAFGVDVRSSARARRVAVARRGQVQAWTPALQIAVAAAVLRTRTLRLELDLSGGALVAVARGRGDAVGVEGRRDAAVVPLGSLAIVTAQRLGDGSLWWLVDLRAQQVFGDVAVRAGTPLRRATTAQLSVGLRWDGGSGGSS